MNASKIVVFDLDETLGYFVEFGMFWQSLKSYLTNKKINYNLKQDDFNNILDLYPEYLRPDIIDILNYLKQKRKNNNCNKLMIYTNNQGPPDWVSFIKHYFEEKISYTLFDQIIYAFKINGQKIEICRTSHRKSHSDFISCTKVPEHTQICFLDDTYYPDMEHDNVYYINIKPYSYDLEFDIIIDRFLNSKILKEYILDEKEFKETIIKSMNKFNFIYQKKDKSTHEIDIILSKKIMHHLHIFFNKFNNNIICDKTKNKTKYNNQIHYKQKNNKTLKKRRR